MTNPDPLARTSGDEYAARRQAILTKEAEQQSWLDAYRSVFERANRIVTGANLDLKLANVTARSKFIHLQDTPGWTDGKTVYLNRKMMNEALENGEITKMILAVKGVNYHEVAHCLFTPRMNSKLVRTVKQETQQHSATWWAFNVLEDQRAETFFAGTYSTAIVYFTNAVAEWILKKPEEINKMWPLVSGRRYLPKTLRKHLRALYIQSNLGVDVERLDAIIREYQSLIFPKDYDQALRLIVEFRDLFHRRGRVTPSSHGRIGSGIKSGSPVSQKQQQIARDNLDISLEEWDQEGEEEYDGEIDDSPDEEIDSAEKAQGGNTSPGDGEANEAGDVPNPNGATIGSDTDWTEGLDPEIKELQEIADKITEDLQESEAFKEDLEAIQDAVKAEMGSGGIPMGTKPKFRLMPPQETDWKLQRKLIHHFREITHDLEPRWERGNPSGYLDVERAMLATHGDLDVFERWDEGREDEAETEVVILLDQSVSMTGEPITRASRVLWSIKGALDKVGIRTTVFGFSDGWTLLYDPIEKVSTNSVRAFRTYGGTNPAPALEQGWKVLRKSSASNKVVIIVTDGDWFDTIEYRTAIKALRNLDAIIAIVNLIGAFEWDLRRKRMHGAHVSTLVKSIPDVAKVIQELVGEIMAGVGRW